MFMFKKKELQFTEEMIVGNKTINKPIQSCHLAQWYPGQV